MTGFPQGEILSDRNEKGECLGREDDAMNLTDILRPYTGISPQATGGMHSVAQTSTLRLPNPAPAAQPGEAELPANNNAKYRQTLNVLSTATVYGAPVER